MASKSDLENRVAQNAQLTKRASKEVVEAVLKSIQELTLEDGKLAILGFGNFEIRERSPRKGRNPQTGEKIDIPASKTFSFKAGKGLKDAVKNTAK